jgi:hypothetical protein
MVWEKGKAKTGGRKKGTKNKSTEKSRQVFIDLMSGQLDNVKEALEEIRTKDKKQYLYILAKYFPYFLPKQTEIDITVDTEELPFSVKIEHRKNTDSE